MILLLFISEQVWPYCFPRLHPVAKSNSTYQPIKLHRSSANNKTTLFNVNAMESVASAMEGSTLAARNVALLLLQEQ